MYKALLLDIDDTIYSYRDSHKVALNAAFDFVQLKFGIERKKIEPAFFESRKEVQIRLAQTASSHNRMLYFQRLLELLDLPCTSFTLEIYEVYWTTFLNAMVPFDGVDELLRKYKNRVCFITDLTAHIQHRKILVLKLDRFVDLVVTSEEAGCEKPHPFIFDLALRKLKCSRAEVCMIGDNFNKDIQGANRLGIKSIWLNSGCDREKIESPLISEVKSFTEILKLV